MGLYLKRQMKYGCERRREKNIQNKTIQTKLNLYIKKYTKKTKQKQTNKQKKNITNILI